MRCTSGNTRGSAFEVERQNALSISDQSGRGAIMLGVFAPRVAGGAARPREDQAVIPFLRPRVDSRAVEYFDDAFDLSRERAHLRQMMFAPLRRHVGLPAVENHLLDWHSVPSMRSSRELVS